MPEPEDARPRASRTLYNNARREARIVTLVWGVALVWSVGVSYVMGYEHGAESLVVRLGLAEAGPRQPGLLLGVPDWVFWGILLPWFLVSLFTVWFGLKAMADDPLDRDASGTGGGHGH